MATAIIGIGNIGGTLARHLVGGGEPVVLAAKDEANAAALAQELGELARAASVEEAITAADAVIFAVWLDTIKELTAKDADLLEDKVVVQAGQKTDFDTQATRDVSPVDKSVTAWTQGMLLADKMRLADFVAELARYRRGFLRYDPAIANMRISGTFPVSDTRLALNMLVSTYPVAATVRLNGYWISLSSR